MSRLLLAFILFAFSASAQAQVAPSDWVNQRGSTMRLDYWDPFTKSVAGHYVNNAPGYPHCAGKPYRLWGLSDGRNITFSVRWSGFLLEDCRSTTVWTGRIVGNRLPTVWVLTRDNGEVYRGSDTFTRR